MESRKLITAALVAPMDLPSIKDGGVLIGGGRILAVGRAEELRGKHPDAIVEEFPCSILTPGLVNAHTHLELSDQVQGPPPSSFVDWLMNLISQTSRWGEAMPRGVADAVATGVEQCVRFGVTTAGDISKQCMFSRPALRDAPIRVISFGEIQAMAKRRVLLDERFAAAADDSHKTERLTIGISPHAPYTVEAHAYQFCLEYARKTGAPLATHLAENPQEAEFLADHTGPFRHLWEVGVNAWDEKVPRYSGGPIRLARDLGLLDHPTLLAHVNYCDDDELAILAAGRASVVYCPRTHKYFGHPPHRWREMLAAGVNVAVGTDSCASSPDLNLLDDLRLMHRIAPEVDAAALWQMATIRAARALQLENEVGSLTPGKRADVVAWASDEKDGLTDLLNNSSVPKQVWIEGRAVPGL
jgi:cytosine/adenosine deaminase-related metal-dependent hydrolase